MSSMGRTRTGDGSCVSWLNIRLWRLDAAGPSSAARARWRGSARSVDGEDAFVQDLGRVVDNLARVSDGSLSLGLVGEVVGAGRVVQLVAATAQVAKSREWWAELGGQDPFDCS